jgi:hypothetical protein
MVCSKLSERRNQDEKRKSKNIEATEEREIQGEKGKS